MRLTQFFAPDRSHKSSKDARRGENGFQGLLSGAEHRMSSKSS